MKSTINLTALTLAAALSACGGGDDTPTGTAEGIWGGTTSSGWVTALIVLETGETWGVYAGGTNAGLLHRNTSAIGHQVSGAVTDDTSRRTQQGLPATQALMRLEAQPL